MAQNGSTIAAPPITDADAVLTTPGAEFEMAYAEIRGAQVRVWKHIPRTLNSLLTIAKGNGEATFLVMDDDRVSYDAFGRAVAILSSHLKSIGVAQGDRVAIAMRNLPEWPVAFFAAASCGAIAVPLNAWWTGSELQVALNDCGACVLICDEARWTRLIAFREGIPCLRHVLALGGTVEGKGIEPLEAVIGSPGSWASLPIAKEATDVCDPDDDAAILYTSGTSGPPKGAIASHRNLLSCIGSMRYLGARAMVLAGLPPAKPLPKSLLLVVPFFHVTGCAANLLPHMLAGSKVVLMNRWEPTLGLTLIERERITATGGVPTIATQILNHPERARFDLSSLEVLTYGGAPAPPDLAPQIKLGLGCAPGNGWGMTETSGTLTGHIGDEYLQRPESAGRALPVADVRILVEGREAAEGEVGEMWVRGPGVVRGYWERPDATAETFVDGWLRTGDLCRIDGDGFIYVVDRLKDVIIRGGENIYCVEVETALLEHPEILDAAVIGLAHDILGQTPAAVVQLRPGSALTADALKAFVGTRLAAYKIPTRVVFGQEPLERNANGKVVKKTLHTLFDTPAV